MPTTVIAAIPPIIAPAMIIAAAGFITNGQARHNHARRADGRNNDHRRRARKDRLSDDNPRPGQRRQRQTDADADLDAGLGERQTTYENGCD